MLQIYYGNGKGKTTAALGLAIRSLGANKKVALVQFMKKPDFSEHLAIKKYKLPIDVFAFGIGFYKILGDKHTDEEHYEACAKALDKAHEIIKSKKYNLIILDEINVALKYKLINIDDVLSILMPISHIKSQKTDIILTGRYLHPKLKTIADLVTEMKEIKHYFKKDLKARKGIEY